MFSSTVFSLFTLNIDDVKQKIRLSLGGCKKNGRTIKTANICDLFNHNLAFSFGVCSPDETGEVAGEA